MLNNLLEYDGQTGLSLYVVASNLGGQWWNGSGLETFSGADYATYAIALTEATGSGHYSAPTPALAPGVYCLSVRKRLGSTPSLNDIVAGPPLSSCQAYWDGTAWHAGPVTLDGYFPGQDPATLLSASNTYLTTIALAVWSTLTSALAGLTGSIGKALGAMLGALGSDARPILSASDPNNALSVTGTVNDLSPGVNGFQSSGNLSQVSGIFVGQTLKITQSTANPSAAGAESIITGYVGGRFSFGPTPAFPLATLLPTAPANGDTYQII